MKQLVQKLSDGRQLVLEVPTPQLESGRVLVRNYYSAVSSGTEGATARSARKNLFAKALERPKDVKAVLELVRRQGITQAYRAVSKKLDAYSPLGYTCAGRVAAVAPDVVEFQVGDAVACAGVGCANHAELVSVPKNLCVKLGANPDFRSAAYNALGAIALQGARRADLRLGESCAVIGLGLIGALTCQLLAASGVRTLGVDVSERAVEHLNALGFESYARNDARLESRAAEISSGQGLDAVVIAAATSSLDPINFAGKLLRKRGRVVVLGDVPAGFDRNPYFYPKELDVRVSCSYGPGRYDPQYEEKGVDYPIAYARWTENRNMAAFQELIRERKIVPDALTTRVFSLDDAPQAYDMILKREEYFLGILIEYDGARSKESTNVPIAERIVVQPDVAKPTRKPIAISGYSFIGAGSYAQGSLLPNLPRDERWRPIAVATRSGTTSRRVAEKFGFRECVSDPEAIFSSEETSAVFIATRHNLHAEYVLRALRSGKSVFVEKPLCLTLDEFVEIEREYRERTTTSDAPILAVGFNRRFAPLAVALKSRLTDAPAAIAYRVNAGAIPKDSWIQDREIGGGRILGEACHFVDFCAWLAGSAIDSVYADAIPDPEATRDSVAIHLRFANGSIATIHYLSNGSKGVPKERVEVFQSGRTGILDDFRRLEFYDERGGRKVERGAQDKGQRDMLRRFREAVVDGLNAPIPANEIFQSTLATFAVEESISTRRIVSLN